MVYREASLLTNARPKIYLKFHTERVMIKQHFKIAFFAQSKCGHIYFAYYTGFSQNFVATQMIILRLFKKNIFPYLSSTSGYAPRGLSWEGGGYPPPK